MSGNPKVVDGGLLTIVVSGPQEAWLQARPLLELLGAGVTYVGEGERARLVKRCHNLMVDDGLGRARDEPVSARREGG